MIDIIHTYTVVGHSVCSDLNTCFAVMLLIVSCCSCPGDTGGGLVKLFPQSKSQIT